MSQRKMALFVEGQTESIFVKKLLIEVAGEKNIEFQEESNAKNIIISNKHSNDIKKYFVLIVDCNNDDSVKTRILENRDRLIRANYDIVIGLRDTYPIPASEINQLERGLRTGVPTKGLQIEFCLAVMEIEAWFLQESNHYVKIDNRLTRQAIIDETGFDPVEHNAENVEQPASLLKNIYSIAGKSYRKKRNQVNRTVDALDYEEMYTVLPEKVSRLKVFLKYIDSFMQ
ncbi:DUF4276 family protein [bacterium SCSIO 12696]|nr:DUF4276 family protein [bacterium SCSIO 12696]